MSAGSKSITFVDNDSIDIEFVDEVGNVGHKTVTVDWIHREEPTGTVTYSTTDITDQPVVATVEPDKDGVTVTSEGGATHTFDANGDFTFELLDAAGNVGTATANVYWIKHTPKVEVSFSPAAGTMTKDPVDVEDQASRRLPHHEQRRQEHVHVHGKRRVRLPVPRP